MILGEIGETLELFMMIAAVIISIWIILAIQKGTGTGFE